MKIKLALVALGMALMSVFMAGCGNDTKLGYLDAERVMNEAPQIKTIRDNIDTKNKEIEAKEQDLYNKKASMSDEDFKKEQMNIQRQYQGLDMQYKSQIKNTMDKVLAEVSTEKELSAVVPKTLVRSNGMQIQKQEFVIQGGIDITDEVIQKLQ
ncbi:OmpH family outer membrane protein [Megamonas hypermegale]|uniref:OmpH family outer membrane protein n=1 Tax=Megamonas hypermegale TaxID=158847 RepID=UPI0025A3ED53|nr:OmpH family outer membrane protein [Megamonas hypermegale]MDM8143314.1 OmpH family outer membrane protein [Megamonas hypermegale]